MSSSNSLNPRQLKEAVLRNMTLEEIENLKQEALQRYNGGNFSVKNVTQNEEIERLAGQSARAI